MSSALRLAVALLIVPAASCARGDGGVRPNVLVIVADDLASAAVGAFGGPVGLTPSIDRLAGEGVAFERAVVSSPFCTPSRQSFLTGRWPHAIGVTQVNSELPEDVTTLATVFGAAGYRTAAVGKMHWHEKRFPDRKYGFDEVVHLQHWLAQLSDAERNTYDEHREAWRSREEHGWSRYNPSGTPLDLPEDRQAARFLVDRTLAFVDGSRDRPWLAFCSFYEPHAPFTFPASAIARVPTGSVEAGVPDLAALSRQAPAIAASVSALHRRHGEPTADERRGFLTSYLRSVTWLDSQVGRLLDGLEARGLEDETIVVFWSDHGFFLGEHGLFGKNFPFREAIEVPLVVRAPGMPRARRQELVQLVDLFPTLCEMSNVEPPRDLHGSSLAGWLEGDAAPRGQAYSEFIGLWGALQTDRYKLVLGTSPGAGMDQLYDLESDPAERRNLVREPALAPVVGELTRRMHAVLAASPPRGPAAAEWLAEENAEAAVRRAIATIPEQRGRARGASGD